MGSLIDRILTATEPFLFANLGHEYEPDQAKLFESLPDASWDERVKWHRHRTGNLDNLEKFDSSFPFNQTYVFNGGLWASSRDSFSIDWFNQLRQREINLFQDHLGKPYHEYNFGDLFYGDQAKLAYLAHSNDVNVGNLYPDGHYRWGGHAFSEPLGRILSNQASVPFIHWAGVPRPSESLFSRAPLFYFNTKLMHVSYTFKTQKSVPALNAWEYFSRGMKKRPLRRTLGGFRWIMLPAIRKMLSRLLN